MGLYGSFTSLSRNTTCRPRVIVLDDNIRENHFALRKHPTPRTRYAQDSRWFTLVNDFFFRRLPLAALALVTFVFALIATSRPAYGYVDPGSGLLALQTFASVMAACGFFLRRRLKTLFRIKSETREEKMIEGSDKTGSRNAA